MNSYDQRSIMKTAASIGPRTSELIESFEARAFQAQPALFSPAELPERLWTLDEVAEFLQMSKDWVRDHATRRLPRIPSIRLGARRKVLRFRPQDVNQFLNEHFEPGIPK
jgi:predicted DNA-binding transcriptional regulator AlpA